MTGRPAGERTISLSEFQAKCLELLDEVAAGGQELVITKHGQPVLRLVPYRTRPETLFGIDQGRFEIVGDVDGPIDVEWEAETSRGRDSDEAGHSPSVSPAVSGLEDRHPWSRWHGCDADSPPRREGAGRAAEPLAGEGVLLTDRRRAAACNGAGSRSDTRSADNHRELVPWEN